MRRVDPQLILVAKTESSDRGEGWSTSPHITFIGLRLEGTNRQSIVSADSGTIKDASTFNIPFASEDLANRVVKAMKRAVQLAGGKPSAF